MFGREVGLGVEMEVGMGGPGWGVDEPPALKRGVMLDAGGYGADRDGEDEGTAVAAGLRFLRRGVAVAEEEVLLALDRDDFGFALGETDEGWRGVRGTAVRVDVVEREEEEEEVEGEGDEGRGDVPCGVGVSCGFSAVLFDIKSACCSTRNASLIFSLRAPSISCSNPMNSSAYSHSLSLGNTLRTYVSTTFSYPSPSQSTPSTSPRRANHSSTISLPADGQSSLSEDNASVVINAGGKYAASDLPAPGVNSAIQRSYSRLMSSFGVCASKAGATAGVGVA